MKLHEHRDERKLQTGAALNYYSRNEELEESVIYKSTGEVQYRRCISKRTIPLY